MTAANKGWLYSFHTLVLYLLLFSPLYAATLVGHYQFDVCTSAALGYDSSGQQDGTPDTNVSLSKTPPAGTQTCSAANFRGGTINISGIGVSTNTGDKTTVSFWMYWDGTNNIMPIGWQYHDLWFYGGNFGFNSASGDLYGISSAGLANSWHHVTAVFTNGNLQANKLYIDGVLQSLTQRRRTPNNARAYVNTNMRISGWLANNGYRFSGYLDEVKIYNGELTQAEVTADYTYTSPSCTVCPPDPPPVLIGHYQFDVCSSSLLGKDSLGLNDGVNTGAVSVGKQPPAGKPDTCSDSVFSGGSIDINGLSTSTVAGDKTSVSFWMYWDGTNSVMPLGWNSYDLWLVDNYFGFNTGGGDVFGISSAGLANGWHHVAAVFTNGSITDNELYIDGALQSLQLLRGRSITSNANVGATLRIGGWLRSTGYRYSGRLDELKVYKGKITQAEVDADRAYASATCTACPPPPPAELKAYYSFNENWTTDVRDIIGNFTGYITGSVARTSAPSSGLKGDTCYAADFNGGAIDITGLPLSTDAGDKTSVSFWMYWDGNNSVMPMGWNRHDLWFYNGNFGFNTANGDIYGISSSSLPNGWHHIAVVFTNGSVIDNSLYIDGVKQTLTLRRSTINNSNAYVDPHLRIGGWWASNGYRFRGTLDDFKVYTGVISEEQVLNDMRANGCLIAEWRLDENNWNGTPGEVTDNSFNAYHGTAFNGVNTVSANTVGGVICRAGAFADNGYVSIDTMEDMTDSFTVTGWFNTRNNAERGQRIFADDEKNNSGGYAVSVGDPGAGRIRFYHRSLSTVSLDSSSIIVNNQWYFVAAVLTVLPGGQIKKEMYIYDLAGSLLEHVSATVSNTMNPAPGKASIGGEVNGSGEEGNRFNGYLDEIKLFSKALTAAEISTIVNNERSGKNWDGTTRSCSSSCLLDSLEVIQADHALACPQNRAAINITARCASGIIKQDYLGIINLASNRAGSQVFEQPVGGTPLNQYQFAATDNGVKTLYLYHNQEETVQLSAFDAVSNVLGIGNATDFRAFGFSSSPISTQTACIDSNTYQLTAIGQIPGGIGCDVIEGFNGTKNLKVWFSYIDPAGNAAATPLSLNGHSLPLSESSTQAFTFINGRTNYSLNYRDAGQLALHFKYDTAPYNGSVHQPMFYDSNVFTTIPDKLYVYASNTSGIPDSSAQCNGASCSVFKQADENFSLTIRAACSDNSITPNFYYTGPVNLSSDLKMPASGVGNISANSFNNIDAGTKTINESFNDAGIITISASLSGTYLGQSLSLSNDSDWIGRFIPTYFNISTNTPVVADACSGGSGFTYMGQAFGFTVNPEFTITAKSLNGNTVYNYSNTGGDNFWKLAQPAASEHSYTDLSGHAAVLNTNSNSDVLAPGAPPQGTVTYLNSNNTDTRTDGYDGSATLSIMDDYLKYNRLLTAPFNSEFSLTLSASSLTDSDNVCYKLNASDTSCRDYILNINSSAEQRMGRLNIKNAYGSELIDLPVPLFTEYYTGSGFVRNTDDTCTSIKLTDLTLSHTTLEGTYSTSASISHNPFTAGDAGLIFTAPGNGNTGYTDIQVTPSIDNWLLYDWDNGSIYNDAPAARASFGQYKGSRRIIYFREVY